MNSKLLFTLQVISLVLIWVLFTGIAIWIGNLLFLSHRLHDAPSATIGISIVAVPIFFTLASVLTYVFWGLQKDRKEE
ncbi:MAG: hypothetical protein D6748_12875 [Calditrichaeota bacterium]|nr:MAG: hypothetical protein D6748_12875 [Calditrichota bacterium]